MSVLVVFLVLVALIIDAVTFFIIGAIFGIAIKVKRLEEAGYTVTKNDE